MKTKKYTRSSLNKDYFQSLASTRASINKAGGFFAGTVTGLIFGGVYSLTAPGANQAQQEPSNTNSDAMPRHGMECSALTKSAKVIRRSAIR